MEKAALAILIGRFAPPHFSHLELLKQAHNVAEHVLVLVGSANAARTVKNPFTFEERALMLRSLDVKGHSTRPIEVLPIEDYFYSEDLWIAQVQEKVTQQVSDLGLPREAEVVMVGNYSDDSSYYLAYFPQWRKISVRGINDIHSTTVRKMLYSPNTSIESPLKHLPSEIHPFIRAFKESDVCQEMSRELKYIESYRESWAQTPFPVIFVTVDNVVTCMGHVLVITRKTHPGKGLYAVPGGFIRPEEFIQDAALRELKEETGIRVDKPVLRRSIVDTKVFDYPGRSLRGRTITHAFHIRLEGKELPEVKGGDDAARAFWMPFADVFSSRARFFEDHFSIIRSFLGV